MEEKELKIDYDEKKKNDKKLTLTQMRDIINDIVDSCFDVLEYEYDENDKEIGIVKERYNPIFKYVKIQLTLAELFTDVTFDEDEKNDIEKRYAKVCNVDVNELRYKYTQADYIVMTVEEMVEERRKQNDIKANNESLIRENMLKASELDLQIKKTTYEQNKWFNELSEEDKNELVEGLKAMKDLPNNPKLINNIAKLVHKDNMKDADYAKKNNVANLQDHKKVEK